MKNLPKPFCIIMLFAILNSTYAQTSRENLLKESPTEKNILIEKITQDIAEAFTKQDYTAVGELVKKYSNEKIPNTDDLVTTMTKQLKYVEGPSSWKMIKFDSYNRALIQYSIFYIRFKKLTLFFRIIVKNDDLIDIKYNTTPREIFGNENSNLLTVNEKPKDDSITVYMQQLAIENSSLYELYNKLGSLMNINVPFAFKEGLKDVQIIYMKQFKSFYIGSDFEQRFFIIQARSKEKIYTEVCSVDFHKNSPTEFYINSWNCLDY